MSMYCQWVSMEKGADCLKLCTVLQKLKASLVNVYSSIVFDNLRIVKYRNKFPSVYLEVVNKK